MMKKILFALLISFCAFVSNAQTGYDYYLAPNYYDNNYQYNPYGNYYQYPSSYNPYGNYYQYSPGYNRYAYTMPTNQPQKDIGTMYEMSIRQLYNEYKGEKLVSYMEKKILEEKNNKLERYLLCSIAANIILLTLLIFLLVYPRKK